MGKKINILSSIDLSMLGDELDFFKKKTNLNFSIDSANQTYKKIENADIYISSAKVKVDKKSGKIISTGQLTIVGLPNEFN